MRLAVAFATSVAVCAVLGAGVAHADRHHHRRRGSGTTTTAPTPPSAPTPWSEGVSPENQKQALALFTDGNQYFEQAKYTEAVGEYEKALVLWDHPNIRFNLAICLINMRQPLVAWDHLKQALRFGDAPLGKKLYADAQTYLAVLEESLSELVVSTTQPDVKVMLDGKDLFVGPSSQTLHLMAGSHQLSATRKGYQTDSRALDLPAGKTTTVELALKPEQVKLKVVKKTERVNYERRWRWWVPWSFMSAGIALGLGGTGFYLWGRSTMKDYDKALADQCPVGCRPEDISPDLRAVEDRAKRRSGIGLGLWVAGGAVAVTAGVMAILNRPRKMEERKVTPTLTLSPDYVGAGVGFAFE